MDFTESAEQSTLPLQQTQTPIIETTPTIETTTESISWRHLYAFLTAVNLTLSSVSTILCGILIAAMTLPLLSPRRRKHYSTYNLYLVYLAIPDLLANAFVVYLILSYHTHNNFAPISITTANDTNYDDYDYDNNNDNDNDKEAPESVMWMFDHPFDHNIYAFCVTANLYTNAFLTLEIYRLLSDCQKRKRHDPPTVVKTTKKAMISYVLGIFIFLLEYGVSDHLDTGGEGRGTTTTTTTSSWFILYQVFSFVYVVLVPLSTLVIVCWKIHRKGLVRSTGSMYEGRLRVLVVYFARIVISYLCLWGPASIAYMVSWSTFIDSKGIATKVIAYNVFLLFSSTHAIVNFALSLTKPDARKLAVELFRCYNQCCCKDTFNSYSTDTKEDGDAEDGGNGTMVVDTIDPYLKVTAA